MPFENIDEFLPVLGQMGIHSQTLRRSRTDGHRVAVNDVEGFVLLYALRRGSQTGTTMAIKFVDVEPEDGAKPKKAAAPKPAANAEADAKGQPSDDLSHPKPEPRSRGRKSR